VGASRLKVGMWRLLKGNLHPYPTDVAAKVRNGSKADLSRLR